MDSGGIAHAFNMLVPRLEAKGYEIHVIVPYLSDIQHLCIPLRYVKGYIWKYKINNKWLRRAVNLMNWVSGWRLYFAFAKRFPHDIFVVYAANMMPWWVVYSNKPVIGWLHGIWSLRTNTFMGPFFRKWVNSLCKRYSRLISVSKSTATEWEREFNLCTRPTVIPNIVEVSEILGQSDESPSLMVKSSVPIFLTVGRLSQEKGQLRLIDVYGRLKKEGYVFSAYFIGKGGLDTQCQARIDSLGLSQIVHMLGEIKNPYPYMEASDLLIVPSFNEGRSCVITEALTLGTPILSTDCGGPHELLKNGKWGRLVENSSEGLYAGIKEFLEYPAQAVPKVDRAIVRKEYDLADNEAVARICAVFDEF